MEHTITKNQKYCDKDCFRIKKQSKKVVINNVFDYPYHPEIKTFELKPYYLEKFNRKYNEPEPDFKFG